LVATSGYAKMVLDGRAGPLNPTQEEYMRVVVRNTDEMVRVLRKLGNTTPR
jgi:hypothetical protein